VFPLSEFCPQQNAGFHQLVWGEETPLSAAGSVKGFALQDCNKQRNGEGGNRCDRINYHILNREKAHPRSTETFNESSVERFFDSFMVPTVGGG